MTPAFPSLWRRLEERWFWWFDGPQVRAEDVLAGVRRLDRYGPPDWYCLVAPATLSMNFEAGSLDLLTLVFGSRRAGLDALRLEAADGIDFGLDVYDCTDPAAWARLDTLWRDAVLARRKGWRP